MVSDLLKEVILKGFSKMGYATNWEYVWNKQTGEFLYELITEFKLLAMSLVSAPANGMQFEKLQEVKRNGLVFRNIEKENTQKPLELADL